MGRKKTTRSRITGFNLFHGHIVRALKKQAESATGTPAPTNPPTADQATNQTTDEATDQTPKRPRTSESLGGDRKRRRFNCPKQRNAKLSKNLGHRFLPGVKWSSLPTPEKAKWQDKALKLNMKKEVTFVEDEVERYIMLFLKLEDICVMTYIKTWGS